MISKRGLFGLLSGAAASPVIAAPPKVSPPMIMGVDPARPGLDRMAIATLKHGKVVAIRIATNGSICTASSTVTVLSGGRDV